MFSEAKEAALAHLKNKDKTSFELQTFLEKKSFSKEIIDEVICFLVDCFILDDERYAMNYIEESIRKRKGRKLICTFLKEKGIDPSLAEKLTKAYLTEEMERNNAREETLAFLDGKRDVKSLGKAMARLAYLGYEDELIFDLMESLQYDSFYAPLT